MSVHAKCMVERLAARAFCVLVVKRLLPFVGHRRNLAEWFSCRESAMVAVDDLYTGGLQLAEPGANGNQIGVHQLDQRPAEQEIKPDEGDQLGGIVEHYAGHFLSPSSLFD